jgi:CHASE3 domain sensor protein
MKIYELDTEQAIKLEQAFLLIPPQDGMMEKFEAGNNKLHHTAKYLMTLTKKSPAQMEMLKKLQEVNHWFKEAVLKHEGN